MAEKVRWADQSPEWHIDRAQEFFEKSPPNANGLHYGLIAAQMHVQLAAVLAQKPLKIVMEEPEIGTVQHQAVLKFFGDEVRE